MKTTRKHAKSLLVVLLAILALAITTQPAFAGVHEEILATGAEQYSEEYYAYAEMYAQYVLDMLPTASETEALARMTILPEYDEMQKWSDFFVQGDPEAMRDEVYSLANKWDLTNPNLSVDEKIKRITDWANSGYPLQSPLGWSGWHTSDSGVKAIYDCDTIASGMSALYRMAGIPAFQLAMSWWGSNHVEGFFFANGTWRHVKSQETVIEYFRELNARTPDTKPVVYIGNSVGWFGSFGELNRDYILDVDESWVNEGYEQFMSDLLQRPYLYPEKTLTRGEVAKILCNYLSAIPMKNEQVFSDVPLSHPYSCYIWAMNECGIMMGNGDGTFRPDSELSMQEFAVMAMRATRLSAEQAIKYVTSYIQDIKNDPINWPPDNDYTKNVIKRYEESLSESRDFLNPEIPLRSGRPPKVFADNDKIAAWAKSAVDDLSILGVLEGDSKGNDSRLNPAEPMSRVRFLVFLRKLGSDTKLSIGLGLRIFEAQS
jgi:hypothetical protein